MSPNPTTKGTRATGSGTFIPSFGQSFYRLFFCFDASATFEQAKYYETSGGMKYTDLDGTTTFDKSISRNGAAGVLMGFAPGTAHTFSARMGISWISTEKACAYAEEEIPDISAFDTVHTAARSAPTNFPTKLLLTFAQSEMERCPRNDRGRRHGRKRRDPRTILVFALSHLYCPNECHRRQSALELLGAVLGQFLLYLVNITAHLRRRISSCPQGHFPRRASSICHHSADGTGRGD